MNSKLEKKENNLEKSFFSIFITTFTTIFIAELGDKTQIATLMLSAESGRPIIVFLGSSLALISSSIVGVLIGKWVSKKISPSKFALFTGALMILISIFLAYETFKNYFLLVLSLLLSTFLTVFIAELGDKTQLATLTISGTSNKPLAVFLGSSSALVFASLLGALTGGSISSFLPEVVLKSIASITFFIIGIRLFINSFTIEKGEKEEKENN